MKYNCPKCRKPIANEDRRRRPTTVRAENGAAIQRRQNEAIRVKCMCGHTTVLLKASL